MLAAGLSEEAADYSIVRLQHSLARGSNVGLLATNRHFLGDDAGSVGLDTTTFFTDTLGMTAQLMRVHGPKADGVLRSWVLDATIEVVFRRGWKFELESIDEFNLFEKEFRNDRTVLTAGWDGRDGRSISTYVGSGFNFDNDLTLYGARLQWAFGDHWRLSYDLTRLELAPDLDKETTTIHILEALYSWHPDLFVKLFVQTSSAIDKENVQALWVWRFKPPFGSLQVAYQRGTSEFGQQSQQGDTFFTKLAWVF